MAVKTKAPKATKAASKKKAAPPPKPVVEEESSEEEEEDDSSEEEAVPVKQAKVAEEDDSDEESEDEESEEEANGKGADSDEEEEEDSDEEEAVAAEEDSDDEEEEDSDEEESKPVKRKAAAAKEPAKKKAKKEAGSDSEEESEEESEAEEESDEEESNDSEEPKSFFVGSLPSAWGEEELRKFFKTNHVKVSRCSKREGKMFGHVDAAPADEEKIMKLNGKQVEGSAIKVDVAGGGKSADGGAQVDRFADERKRTVFVRNMDWNLSDHDIKEHFAGCDSVSMPLRDDGKPKGFAFVVFPTEDACDKAIADNNGVALGERELACSKASDRPAGGTPRGGARGGRGDFGGRGRGGRGGRGGGTGDGAPSKKLFIKNLDFGVTSETLGGYFEGATNCHVATDRETGQSRGFAFVEFDSVDNAKEAFNGAKGAQIEGRDIFLDFAQDREREGGGRGGGRGGGGRGFGGGRGGGGRGFGGGRGGGRGRGSFFEGQGKRKSFDD